MNIFFRGVFFSIVALSTTWMRERADAVEFFLDTFNDGDHEDGTPVLWKPGSASSGERTVVNGRLVHTPEAAQNMSTYAAGCLGDELCHDFEDASLRTSFLTAGSASTFVTLFARSRDGATLYGGVDVNGDALLAMSIGGNVTFLSRATTGLDPTAQEVSLRFDLQGDAMALWMWPTNGQRPELATATAQVPILYPNAAGAAGFFYNPGESTNVSFDFFQALAVPEPTGLSLAALATFMWLGFRRPALSGRNRVVTQSRPLSSDGNR